MSGGDTEARGDRPTPMFEAGTLFGRYRIHGLIGSGAIAEVYEASHVEIKKRVAVKVVRPSYAQRADMRERFIREGEAAARIDHPNAVDIIDVGVEHGLPYLVMEFLEGETLSDLLSREKVLDLEQITNLMLPVISAVSVGHSTGIIHRDLKPDNIFLATDGLRRTIPKILDFGVSVFTHESKEGGGKDTFVVGTPHYMSPEQARGEEVSPASDQYSLGVILYEVATGRLPRDSKVISDLVHQVAYEGFPAPTEVKRDLPARFEQIILRAMQSGPEDRYRSVRDLGLALLRFATPRAREFWEPEFAGTGEKPDLRVTDSDVPKVTADLRAKSTMPPSSRRAGNSDAPIPLGRQRIRRKKRSLSPLISVAVIAGLVVLGLTVWPELRAKRSTAAGAPHGSSSRYRVQMTVEPSQAEIVLDGNSIGVGKVDFEMMADGVRHVVHVRADGYTSFITTFLDEPPTDHVVLDRTDPVVEETK